MIGSQSKKLAANNVVTTAMPARNHGCWNCMPHPSDAPASLRMDNTVASNPNEVTIPKAVASATRLAVLRSVPAAFATEKTLIERTGNTHGMKFRIRPPSSAKPRMTTMP